MRPSTRVSFTTSTCFQAIGRCGSGFRSWASIVKSTDIFEEFDGLRSASRLRPESEQFRSCVWAKPFYEQVVYASASGLQSLRGTSYSTWMMDLATNMSVPADLSGIFSEFLE